MDKSGRRRHTNIVLLDKLRELSLQYPDLRFIQLLYLANIIDKEDRFYEESMDTWERVNETITGWLKK